MIVDGGLSVVQGVHAAGACRRLSYDGLAGHPRTWKTPLGLNVETTDPEALVLQESQTWVCSCCTPRQSDKGSGHGAVFVDLGELRPGSGRNLNQLVIGTITMELQRGIE